MRPFTRGLISVLALALADLALARTAGWTAPVPLALLAVSWAEARAAGRDPAAWLSLCSRCLAGAGVLALTLFSTVHAAAERLLAPTPAKGSLGHFHSCFPGDAGLEQLSARLA